MSCFSSPSKPRSSSWRRAAVAAVGLVVTVTGCESDAADETDAVEKKPKEVQLSEPPPSFPEAPLKVGATVHDFSALAHNGQLVRLSEFLDKPVVVYFCQQDQAEVCTSLALAIRNAWTDLHAQVSMVFAVSPEPTVVHREFSSEHKLSHLFLTDVDATLHRTFGIQPGTVVSYLIGADGTVRHVFEPPASDHGAEILNTLTALGLRRTDFPI